MAELKNALRSGDIWAQGSRRFKDFDEYLLLADAFGALKHASELPVAVSTDRDQYLHDRLQLLEQQLTTVNRLANELPVAIITDFGLKITSLDSVVPETAQVLLRC